MKNIIVLGATGSIGKATLDIIRHYPDHYRLAGLSAHTNGDALVKLHLENIPTALSGKKDPRFTYSGEEGLLHMIEETEADLVVNGIAGAAGLKPSIAAIRSGKNLALANKETMVMAGEWIHKEVEAAGVELLPIDSEHSALFELLRSHPIKLVERLIITASGGAFRDWPLEKMQNARPEDALKHPTWNMGPKITIDSASMANKGLEVIEAVKLFRIPASRIDVVIHPQSIIHAMVKTKDGSIYPQMSYPDMRNPIQNALSWPDYQKPITRNIDLTKCELTFSKPDLSRFPILKIAYLAAEYDAGYPIVFNAANEIAVKAFFEEKISFGQIYSVINETMNEDWSHFPRDLEDVYETDSKARKTAEDKMEEMI